MSRTIEFSYLGERREYFLHYNGQARDLLGWDDLTPKERSDLSYVLFEERYDWTGFRYRGSVYSLDEFIQIIPNEGWMSEDLVRRGFNGICTESVWSGVVIKVSEDQVCAGYVHW